MKTLLILIVVCLITGCQGMKLGGGNYNPPLYQNGSYVQYNPNGTTQQTNTTTIGTTTYVTTFGPNGVQQGSYTQY